MGRDVLRRQLHGLLAECAPDLDHDLPDDCPLISSGIVESVALLNVALWVDERVGGGVDITAFDLTVEWDTVGLILDFVERHTPTAGAAPGRG